MYHLWKEREQSVPKVVGGLSRKLGRKVVNGHHYNAIPRNAVEETQ